MGIISQLELPGSPLEQMSTKQATYFWDPSPELATGETISAPVCTVRKYDPAYSLNTADMQDVSATVLQSGSPSVGTGTHANMVQIVILANVLTIGYEYRLELGCTGSAGSTPQRYFRIVVKL